MFGMFPRKGTIAPGSDADIVIFDPKKERTISAKTHHMNCDYSLFEGMKIKGYPETVLSRGKVIIENNQYKGKPGEGKFIKRGTCAALRKRITNRHEWTRICTNPEEDIVLFSFVKIRVNS